MKTPRPTKSVQKSADVMLREDVRPADANAVREMVSSTGFFADHEVDVAVELVQDRLARGSASDYLFLFADVDGRTVGYACYGRIACTVHSFDLYWIAVHNDYRDRGIGKVLLRASEEAIARAGGRRIYVETSSREQYTPTRAFYERCNYTVEAVLADFYAPGDGKVIFVKAV
jgi:D-alanine-D-alanine ligase